MSPPTVIDARRRAQILIVRNLQNKSFSEELDCLEKKKGLPKTTPLLKLSPVIDPEGLLRVGGRLERADLTHEERHPLILPGKHHATSLIVKHCHEEVKHQGRHFTHGMIRGKGFWIVGGKRLVNRVINQCLNCRRLRGKLQDQKMADLPTERLTPSPPFTYVGLDVFGPWEVTARRTRGGHANSKRWAVIFTCFSTRAIHIELVEGMDTSSFINALRRFMAFRGHVEQIHSDCGTNFIGRTQRIRRFSERDGSEIRGVVPQFQRMQVGLQLPTCLSYRRRVGTYDWYIQTNPRLDVRRPTLDSINPRSSIYANGRSNSHR